MTALYKPSSWKMSNLVILLENKYYVVGKQAQAKIRSYNLFAILQKYWNRYMFSTWNGLMIFKIASTQFTYSRLQFNAV